MEYTDGLRDRMVERMVGSNAVSPDKLALEVGIGKSTLWKWRKAALDGHATNARAQGASMKKKKKKTQVQRSAQEKLQVVLAAAALSEDELGAFLRTQGVHEAELELWKQEMLEGLEQAGVHKRAAKQQHSKDSERIRQLERELGRKERALAEAAALLLLQKKVREIWGDEGDDIDPKSEP
jgi:transposase